MTTPPEELSLAAEFAAPERAEWQRLVAGVLRKLGAVGENFTGDAEELLASTTYDGITLRPLYTSDDVSPPAGMPGLPPFTRGSRPEGHLATGWDVRARHADPDPVAAKRAVLADLENGVTSLWLVLGDAGLPLGSLADVLHEVYTDLAPVTLDAGADFAAAADELLAVHSDKGVPASAVRGNLGADPIGRHAATGQPSDVDGAAALAARVAPSYPSLRTIMVDALPYHDAGGSDAQELGCSLATAVAYLRALTGAGLSVDQAAGQLEFRYAATADQFLTIAKLRAARRLWARVLEVSGAAPQPQLQHAVTSSAMMTRRDPWVNMLRTTLACFGAGVGGADSVTVQPFDAALGLPDSFARRIARNTQSVLLEESKVAGVIDPAGGSWYVEKLSDDLARAAWAWFTEIEAAGGIVSTVDSGLVAERLAATAAERASNIATRTDAITGVSEFPNVAEKLPRREPAPAAPSGGLPKRRYAEDFEKLRDWSDRHLESTGSRPTVFLATLGKPSFYTARATFAANLFGAAGIETPDAGPTETPDDIAKSFVDSGATVACLCGSNRSYEDYAGPVAAALKQAGAKKVLLAGKPDEAWEQAGVDGFVYTGCDALAVLRSTVEFLS
ncbi:heterodimeric methylmalonyl-CoA mutase small subunit [Herbihabitans rhizosphaerae]|uniref:Heterodimeric methylmalonyl-CoA mutase small subunit n=1 Tax=Herbihabitans rhizosphaerae TaxID=1872711 RepID=A0A4Q7KKQ5_9PSEU|nr:methylmalonyl-CoA mutase family protein [Herbihabitans rhizosphaerae]RZS36796.1 heterodimeric methylmalonyl-CoA mutase small subunit [Herbihabitans rhizosphaerae]